MRSIRTLAVLVMGSLIGVACQPAQAAECAHLQTAVGLERVVEIDATTGALFGALSSQQSEPSFLRDKEVVLSFDDGPSPWVTPKILDTLEQHCTKATFFAVGKMAVAYPDVARDILVRGHTLAGHTWSHPRQLPKMNPEVAHAEIERGFAALEAATGGGIAPFFRFTGLNDSAPLLNYLQNRGIATFTVDVVSDDSFIASPDKLAKVTLSRLDNRGSGILLFHDIKPATAKALPAILDGLKARGYRVVHLVYRKPVVAQADLVASFQEKVSKKLAKSQRTPRLMPFYGAISGLSEERSAALTQQGGLPITRISPKARDWTKRPPIAVRSPPKKKQKPATVRKQVPKARPTQGPTLPSADEVLPWKSGKKQNSLGNEQGAVGWQSRGRTAAGVGAPSAR